MKTSLIVLVSCLLLTSSLGQNLNDDVEKIDGGIGIHVANSLFDALKTDILAKGFEILLNLDIPDQNINQDLLGLVQLNGSISNINIVNVGCDLDNSTLRFSDKDPNILFQLIDFYLVIEFDYSMLTEPAIYKDVGHASINVKPFKFGLGMTTKVTDDILSVDLESIDYYFDDYTIEFSGNGDVSFILVSLADSLKPILQADLSPNIEGLLEGLVIPQINTMLAGLGSTIDVAGFVVDYTFMDHPMYSADDFSLVMKGEVRQQGAPPPPFVEDRKVPANYDPSGGFLQVFISDYVVRSLLYSVYESQILTIKYDDNPLSGGKLNVGLVKYLIIDLKKKYIDSTVVYFQIDTKDTPIPEFYIKDGETYLTMQLNIGIGVTPEGGEDTLVASMTAQTDLTLNFGLEDGTKIAASISTFWLNLVGDVTNYDPAITVDTDDFNATLGLIPGLGRNFVNYALDAIDIPIPEIPYVILDLNKTYILEKDGYLIFETSPRIDITLYRPLNQAPPYNYEKSFRNQLSTREAKVEFVKRLVLATPMKDILEEAKKQKDIIQFNPEMFGKSFRKAKTASAHNEYDQFYTV